MSPTNGSSGLVYEPKPVVNLLKLSRYGFLATSVSQVEIESDLKGPSFDTAVRNHVLLLSSLQTRTRSCDNGEGAS
jgi:hypothetical protein